MKADVRAPITAQAAIARINQAAKTVPERAHADADVVLLRFNCGALGMVMSLTHGRRSNRRGTHSMS